MEIDNYNLRGAIWRTIIYKTKYSSTKLVFMVSTKKGIWN